jgi:hypothetical protein
VNGAANRHGPKAIGTPWWRRRGGRGVLGRCGCRRRPLKEWRKVSAPRVVMEPGRVTHAEQRAPDKPDRTSVGLFAIVRRSGTSAAGRPCAGASCPCLTRCVRPFLLDYSFHHDSGPEPMRGRVENSASRPWRPEPALPTAHYHSSVNHLERRAQRQLNARSPASREVGGPGPVWVRELARHLGPGPVVGAEDPGEYMPPKGGRLFFVSAMLSVKRHV